MRRQFFILLFLFCFFGMGYAQNEGGVLKRKVEINKNIKTKSGYNQFLLDVIKEMDALYYEYEELVQKVWDKEIEVELLNSSRDVQKKLDEYNEAVKSMPVYRGGDDYQKAMLDYIVAMKEKIKCLEKYGILGADNFSDVTEYNKAHIAFHEATNDATDKRNTVRKKKDEFEKTVYMKAKKVKK